MTQPGGFTAIAASGRRPGAPRVSLLPLPRAVFVSSGHELFQGPCAVGMPLFRDGKVEVDAVFASAAAEFWHMVSTRALTCVSIHARAHAWALPRRLHEPELAHGPLVAVDLVAQGADPGAVIHAITPFAELSSEQQARQRAFDQFLADPGHQLVIDAMVAAETDGIGALDQLADAITLTGVAL